ncbi:MAG TPA: sulfatase [Candidatus Dormibacteraeota bacterium]|nr:sulfatase [Candidatus Dormibacteraeota bacterium]
MNRTFAVLSTAVCLCLAPRSEASTHPNVVVVIADQWRFDAFGFAGNADVRTPNIDRLALQSIRFTNALSGLPVCSPMRASFLTGQRPLTHGVFMNDVPLRPEALTLSKVLHRAGYDTGYIGKWHLNGDGRSAFIPRERRQDFEYWKVLECTHDYNQSVYFADTNEKQEWDGYDALAQTRDAGQFLKDHRRSTKPFFLVLAWGPPHDPYTTAPEKFRKLYEPEKLQLRPNVPADAAKRARQMLAGYYAHCTALDEAMGILLKMIQDSALSTNTLLIFTSDHGDMLGSQGLYKKQKPYDESIRVPLLIRWPGALLPSAVDAPLNSQDFMPTILGLCGVTIPDSVEGLDYSRYVRGGPNPGDSATVIQCPAPFGEWERRAGGKEFRGVRTTRYTYARDLKGPWLLFDNAIDPYQTNNLAGMASAKELQEKLDALLSKKLKAEHDEFLPAESYIKNWGYQVNEHGTVPYTK